MSAAARLVAKEVLALGRTEAPAVVRGFKTSAAPRAGGGYHYDYEHGPNYLNFQDWPGRKRKITTWILGMWVTGLGVPSFAVWYQQNKLKG
ncbi:hypothetical protein Rsub_00843 [Raphidocelis subcapitata]|uniref:Uncharacterized protein n=1 Tax=Raphidocelis subcapitata TaxID=307507 RepID=A0A2V0NL72_9CHLO|nr:hypothetical protein Rsub_00843 [Raphidocelis subcapitata]|eukprot:GBF88131.1 hypothetical protein Rsub_00843 [Raphidocelis subcapitata]